MSMPYNIDPNIRRALSKHHRAAQAAIAVLANRHLGIEAPPEGIGKFQGGVTVWRVDATSGARRAHEIAIGVNFVEDNFIRGDAATTEEQAVVWAIGEVVELFRAGGAAALKAFLPPAADDVLGSRLNDPLRAMLGLED